MKNRFFSITEWDGTPEVVEVQEADDAILVKYEDGVVHEVSKSYFWRTLSPRVTARSIARRCSQFSGWDLRVETEKGILRMFDPRDYGQSMLTLAKNGREVYGRLRHWGITADELEVLLESIP